MSAMRNPQTAPNYDVAIVGGGFSASCLAIQLLRQNPSISIAIINRDTQIARGVAYRTRCDAHILNVPAARMSILPDEPDHFQRWIAANHNFGPQDFVPRSLYGQYIEATLQQTVTSTPGARVAWIQGSATDLLQHPERVSVCLQSGHSLGARFAVLAIGTSPPQSPACFQSLSSERYKANPWADDTLANLDPSHSVLVLGSGLTAIDQILALSEQTHTGTIYVLSRRGKLPAVHGPAPAWPADWTRDLRGDLRRIVRQVREQILLAETAGIGWRSVIDSLRHASPLIWQSLSAVQKQQFIRHVRPHWETARHRIPASTYSRLQQLIADRRMVLLAGRVASAEERDEAVHVTYNQRESSAPRLLLVDRVINCTGPGTVCRVQDVLLSGLLQSRLARLDPLGFGIETAPDGALISADGRTWSNLYAIGPVRKATLWESTAVGEIRTQAKALAALLAPRLAVSGWHPPGQVQYSAQNHSVLCI